MSKIKRTDKQKDRGLATLLEGAGYTSKISSAISNFLIFLRWIKTVKLDRYNDQVIISMDWLYAIAVKVF